VGLGFAQPPKSRETVFGSFAIIDHLNGD